MARALPDGWEIVPPVDIADGKYRIKEKISTAKDEHLYQGIEIIDNDFTAADQEEIAIKIESIWNSKYQLKNECEMLEILQGGKGIPKIRWNGCERNCNILVMEYLGPSLEDLFEFCSRQFTIKTVLMLAEQLLERIEFIHSKGILHRDIKPKNIVMGNHPEVNTVYLIDFGTGKKFRDDETGQHKGYREDKRIVGCARYSSINSHLGIENSRRDDLESLGYLLIYFIRGSLPWQGLSLHSDTIEQRWEKIGNKKISTPIAVLCEGLSEEFALYLDYCRNLEYDEDPDYHYLKQLFRKLFQQGGYDNKFDWVMLRNRKLQTEQGPSEYLSETPRSTFNNELARRERTIDS